MGKFAEQGRFAVNVENDPHTIYIKPEMNVEMRGKLLDALQVVTLQGAAPAAIGNYQTTLLELFVVGWSGPEFDTVECTPANVRELSPNDALVAEVLEVIGRRNPLGKPTKD